MNQIVSQIEDSIRQLPMNEQLWLISRVAERLSEKSGQPDFEEQLVAMAADEEIQRELRNIEDEFRYTESDGLENF